MGDAVSEVIKHFLYSSTLFVDTKPCEIQTVLGSCVSVCIYDQVLRFGGMNHFMLPLWNGEGLASPKYGNIAIEKLVEKMISLGSNKRSLVAKIFGGAEQLDDIKMYNIGRRNIEVAVDVLDRLSIPIIAKNVGGHTGRKILFRSDTGMVYMKLIDTN